MNMNVPSWFDGELIVCDKAHFESHESAREVIRRKSGEEAQEY